MCKQRKDSNHVFITGTCNGSLALYQAKGQTRVEFEIRSDYKGIITKIKVQVRGKKADDALLLYQNNRRVAVTGRIKYRRGGRYAVVAHHCDFGTTRHPLSIYDLETKIVMIMGLRQNVKEEVERLFPTNPEVTPEDTPEVVETAEASLGDTDFPDAGDSTDFESDPVDDAPLDDVIENTPEISGVPEDDAGDSIEFESVLPETSVDDDGIVCIENPEISEVPEEDSEPWPEDGSPA